MYTSGNPLKIFFLMKIQVKKNISTKVWLGPFRASVSEALEKFHRCASKADDFNSSEHKDCVF